jgi:isocitrate dehydrogenase
MQLIIAIWDKGEDVFTKHIELDKHTKEFKFKGRKPNKIIIPESLKDKRLLKIVKKLGSYNCLIVKATGK